MPPQVWFFTVTTLLKAAGMAAWCPHKPRSCSRGRLKSCIMPPNINPPGAVGLPPASSTTRYLAKPGESATLGKGIRKIVEKETSSPLLLHSICVSIHALQYSRFTWKDEHCLVWQLLLAYLPTHTHTHTQTVATCQFLQWNATLLHVLIQPAVYGNKSKVGIRKELWVICLATLFFLSYLLFTPQFQSPAPSFSSVLSPLFSSGSSLTSVFYPNFHLSFLPSFIHLLSTSPYDHNLPPSLFPFGVTGILHQNNDPSEFGWHSNRYDSGICAGLLWSGWIPLAGRFHTLLQLIRHTRKLLPPSHQCDTSWHSAISTGGK